ncbi:MAG: MBL fold metallo-hydrolase, partial [Sphaerochaetaceae bacterium]
MEHSIDDLHFLGSGSAFNPEMDNTSAWFVRGDMFFLLDCGETVFGKIWNLPEFTFATSIAVILTHMHCDHVGSLGTLLSYCKLVLGKQVTVFYPSDNLEPYLRLVGIAPQFYSHVREVPPAWGIAISVHHVEHADDMDCFGYVIQLDDLSFYYSGDAADIPEAVLSQFLDGAI